MKFEFVEKRIITCEIRNNSQWKNITVRKKQIYRFELFINYIYMFRIRWQKIFSAENRWQHFCLHPAKLSKTKTLSVCGGSSFWHLVVFFNTWKSLVPILRTVVDRCMGGVESILLNFGGFDIFPFKYMFYGEKNINCWIHSFGLVCSTNLARRNRQEDKSSTMSF